MLLRVILAIKEAGLRKRLRGLVPSADVLVDTVETRAMLWEHMVRKSCDLVLASRSVIPDPDPEKIRILHELPDWPVIVIISEDAQAEDQARFLAAGYDAVLSARLPNPQLKAALGGILSKRRERTQRLLSAHPTATAEPSLNDFVSRSAPMQAFMGLASRVVNSDSSLLILGETGVGKERLARAIHAEGPRARGPFISVNCGAFPETLLESELFGHEEGAFTGATHAHRGFFELAHRGVIFLDEIGDMPNHLQVKLLTVLQDRRIMRVGSEQPFAVDVRVMAATNRDPKEEVKAKRLRQDLYYRLNVVTLTIPPLRERREDIPDLVQSYLKWLRPRVGRNVLRVSDEALESLLNYSWPGNVRELINIIERAMLLCAEEEITLADLPDVVRGPQSPGDRQVPPDGGQSLLSEDWLSRPLREVHHAALDNIDRTYLTYHLKSTGGRVGETAKRAGIQPRALFAKMRQYGLRKEDFRR